MNEDSKIIKAVAKISNLKEIKNRSTGFKKPKKKKLLKDSIQQSRKEEQHWKHDASSRPENKNPDADFFNQLPEIANFLDKIEQFDELFPPLGDEEKNEAGDKTELKKKKKDEQQNPHIIDLTNGLGGLKREKKNSQQQQIITYGNRPSPPYENSPCFDLQQKLRPPIHPSSSYHEIEQDNDANKMNRWNPLPFYQLGNISPPIPISSSNSQARVFDMPPNPTLHHHSFPPPQRVSYPHANVLPQNTNPNYDVLAPLHQLFLEPAQVAHQILQKHKEVQLVSRQSLLNEKKLFLILDIDLTLVHAIQKAPNLNPPSSTKIYFNTGREYWIQLRPHVEDFIKQMSKIYHIGLYTQGTQHYADHVHNLLDPLRKYILGGVYGAGSHEKKSISIFVNIYRHRVPQDMLIIVDDLMDVWSESQRQHVLLIKQYSFWSSFFRGQSPCVDNEIKHLSDSLSESHGHFFKSFEKLQGSRERNMSHHE